jgi:hypothetical protein
MRASQHTHRVLGRPITIVATNAKSVTLPDTGHWVMEENPQVTMDALASFLTGQTTTSSSVSHPARASSKLAQMRLTPEEGRANQTGSEQIGSSFRPGVSTKVLAGDPSKADFYTIVLSVPQSSRARSVRSIARRRERAHARANLHNGVDPVTIR